MHDTLSVIVLQTIVPKRQKEREMKERKKNDREKGSIYHRE